MTTNRRPERRDPWDANASPCRLQAEILPTDVELAEIPIPPAVEDLVRDCEQRFREFIEQTGDQTVFGFVQSDLRAVYRGLAWVRRRGLAPGDAFLEWGSGLGAVTMLADLVGYTATGIEVNRHLVESARRIAKDHDLAVEFACGSFLPDHADVTPQDLDEFAWLDTSSPGGYDEIGVDPEDFDLIFAYPWPNEQELLYRTFETYAGRGSCLLTNHGLEGLRLHSLA